MRTVYCGDLNISNVGLSVILCGWVNRCRVFSNCVFVEIRDREGAVQIFFDSNRNYDIFRVAIRLKSEFCLQIYGVVRARPIDQINHNMKTGEIEVLATDINIINSADPLPLDLNKNNSEEQRLKYRYLDLRRSIMFHRLKNRSRIISFIHNFMEEKGFLNIETPMLANPTLEGARDYLVPSRLHKGKFYALPQSPQIFKQLLMISGFDRYYQITKCFRDEDMRSDRQPEFTQIDLETSFMSAEEVREIMESLIRVLWNKILGVELKKFDILTYREAIDRFSSENPDLRNPIRLVYFSNIVLDQIKNDKCFISNQQKEITTVRVMIMCVPGGALLSNKKIHQYVNTFISCGGSNLTWMICHGFGDNKKIEGSAVDIFDFKFLKDVLLQVSISDQDLVFLSYESNFFSHRAVNTLRCRLGKDLELINKDSWAPLWVVDFPMFKKNSQGEIVSVHHLFTAPKNFNVIDLLNDPLSAVSNSFDMIINGCEVGSGSVRIHCRNMQSAVFEILGFNKDIQKNKFGFLLDALKYGAPIHAGMACGLDRLVMLLSNTNNIRDVIAFPKTTNGSDLMINTPSVL